MVKNVFHEKHASFFPRCISGFVCANVVDLLLITITGAQEGKIKSQPKKGGGLTHASLIIVVHYDLSLSKL